MITALAHTVVPTARALRWAPAASLAAVLVLVALLARSTNRPADPVLAIAAAALASTVVAALQDPAADLLAAMPVSLMRRRMVRLCLAGTTALGAWWSLTAVTSSSDAAGPGPLLALSAAGVAVATWAPRRRAVSLGAAVPVAWFVLDRVLLASGAAVDAAAWWRTDPWPIVASAIVLCVAGRHR